ncbi:MAG: protein kinase, partial [Candidatus Eiseniibacteriota bacterium]
MDAERWQRIEALFDAALEQPAAERATWLARAAADGEEAALVAEVARMLAAHDRNGGILDRALAELAAACVDAPAAGNPPDPGGEAPAPPARVDRYELDGEIGRGGMGLVYRAHDTRLDRAVALKLLAGDARDDAARRFLAEARTASALDHPHICTIHDVGETDDGHLFIAMALYEGDTLADRLAAGPLPVDESIAIAGQIAE